MCERAYGPTRSTLLVSSVGGFVLSCRCNGERPVLEAIADRERARRAVDV